MSKSDLALINLEEKTIVIDWMVIIGTRCGSPRGTAVTFFITRWKWTEDISCDSWLIACFIQKYVHASHLGFFLKNLWVTTCRIKNGYITILGIMSKIPALPSFVPSNMHFPIWLFIYYARWGIVSGDKFWHRTKCNGSCATPDTRVSLRQILMAHSTQYELCLF